MKNVTRESHDHTEDEVLSEMKECRPGETTSKEVDHTSGSEARQQDRDSIQLVNMDA